MSERTRRPQNPKMNEAKHNYKIELPDGTVATRSTDRNYRAILVAKVPADEFRQRYNDHATKWAEHDPKYAAKCREAANSVKEGATDHYFVFSWHGTRAQAVKASMSNGPESFRRNLEHQYSRVTPIVIEF